MWMRLTYCKVDPARAQEAITLYNSDEVSGVIRKQRGYRFHHLLQCLDEPDQAISLTAWETHADAEAYQQVYTELVEKFRLRKLFTRPPALKLYQVRD